MRSKAMQTWMSNEMERLSTRLERYKPSGCGYNRIKPIVLSKSVAHMLNNPLPAEDQIARTSSHAAGYAVAAAGGGVVSKNQQRESRMQGILSCPNSEWEEVYPTVKFSRNSSREGDATCEPQKSFAYYRSCSTRIT